MTKKLGVLALLFAANSLYADVDTGSIGDNRTGLKEHGLVLSLGRVNFDDRIAVGEGVEDSGVYIDFGWEGRFYNNVILGAGISAFGYSDNDSFNQWTEDDWGDDEYSSSSAAAVNFYGELGYGVELTRMLSLDLIGGFEAVLSSERSISGCSNCYSEDIDIDSGPYIAPRLRFKPWSHWMFAVSYQSYLSGDVEDSVQLAAGFVF